MPGRGPAWQRGHRAAETKPIASLPVLPGSFLLLLMQAWVEIALALFEKRKQSGFSDLHWNKLV